MSSERLSKLQNTLVRIQGAEKYAIQMRTVIADSTIEHPIKKKHPFLDLSLMTGNIDQDSERVTYVSNILNKIDSKSLPAIRSQEEKLRAEINLVQNEGKLTSLHQKRENLRARLEQLSQITNIPEVVITPLRNSISAELLIVQSEIISFEGDNLEKKKAVVQEIKQPAKPVKIETPKKVTEVHIEERSRTYTKNASKMAEELLTNRTKKTSLSTEQVARDIYKEKLKAGLIDINRAKDLTYHLMDTIKKRLAKGDGSKKYITVSGPNKNEKRHYIEDKSKKPVTEVIVERKAAVQQPGMSAVGSMDFKASTENRNGRKPETKIAQIEVVKEPVLFIDEQTMTISCDGKQKVIEDPVLFEIFKILAQNSGNKISVRACEDIAKAAASGKREQHINAVVVKKLDNLADILVALGHENSLTRLGTPKRMSIALNISTQFKKIEESPILEIKKNLAERELIPSRARALLLFMEKPDLATEELGEVLGPISKGKTKDQPLKPQQVMYAMRNIVRYLSEKKDFDIAYTEQETKLMERVKWYAGTIKTVEALGVLRSSVEVWCKKEKNRGKELKIASKFKK